MTKPPPINTSNKLPKQTVKDDKPLPITPTSEKGKLNQLPHDDEGEDVAEENDIVEENDDNTVNVVNGDANEEQILETDENPSQIKTPPPESTPLKDPEPVKEDADAEYKLIAQRLYDEDFISIKPQEYTQFLAAGDRDSTKIRHYYMSLFEWSPNLLKSTRMLCSKLYLKGESQEIDRILSSFTKSYLKQHPSNVFCTKNFEQIYIIIYSLILLNTALHNSELNKKSRISQTDFIKNTFTTFLQQNEKLSSSLSIKQKISIETELSHFYEDLSRNELHLKTADEAGSSSSNNHNNNNHNNNSHNHHHRHHRHHYQQHQRQRSNSTERSADELTDLPSDSALTRQPSNTSMWSMDTNNRRTSLNMKRYTSTTSQVSTFNAPAARKPVQRVGMARALLGQQQQQQQSDKNSIYKGSNQSMTSHLKPRPSMDQLRTLNKRSSRQSIVSKDSSAEDNAMSVLSFDTENLPSANDSDFDGDTQKIEDFNVEDYQDEYDLILELQGSPYLKEGMLKLKILNNDSMDDSSASLSAPPINQGRFIPASGNSHKFTENFVVVTKGELSLYSFDPKVIKKHKKHRHEEAEDTEVGDGNWLKNAVKIGDYNLCSTFAELGSNTSQGKVSWTLTFPKVGRNKPKVFVFEGSSKENALEFINCCNYWSGKITAIPPMEESVTSDEYGWCNLDGLIANSKEFKNSKKIVKYTPLIRGVYFSSYPLVKQFMMMLKYYSHLKMLLEQFLELRKKFNIGLPKCSYNSKNHTIIVNNYQTKISEYKDQLKIFKEYLLILAVAIQKRIQLMEDSEDVDPDDFWEEDERDLLLPAKLEIEKILDSSVTNIKPVMPVLDSDDLQSPINQLLAIEEE
ncbi:YEL1 Guanine-nucleotide exchange factor YEL1 [Candida maltosa Xu316]